MRPDQPPGDDPEGAGIIDEAHYLQKAKETFDDEDYERALAYYSRALQYGTDPEEAWVGQLRSLIELGQMQEAVVWSERALERFPNSAQILAARAQAGPGELTQPQHSRAVGHPRSAAPSSADRPIGSRSEDRAC